MCPIGAVPQVVMAARLVRNGLQTTMQPMTATWPACDNRSDFVIVSRQHCICVTCGTTARRESIFPKAVC